MAAFRNILAGLEWPKRALSGPSMTDLRAGRVKSVYSTSPRMRFMGSGDITAIVLTIGFAVSRHQKSSNRHSRSRPSAALMTVPDGMDLSRLRSTVHQRSLQIEAERIGCVRCSPPAHKRTCRGTFQPFARKAKIANP